MHKLQRLFDNGVWKTVMIGTYDFLSRPMSYLENLPGNRVYRIL